VRLRVWRALKTLGCGLLRDGVYVLPEAQAALFDPLVTEVRAHGGQASVLELSTRDEAQRAEVLALFDRSEAYSQWRAEAQTLAAALPALEETEARRRWRSTLRHCRPFGASTTTRVPRPSRRRPNSTRCARRSMRASRAASRWRRRRTVSHAWIRASSRASAGRRVRAPGWIGWPAPG
jgi:hypothetical protein